MKPPDNPQFNNVGNIGDIIKHSALVEMSQILAIANPGKYINYIDTHTFLLKAQIKSQAEWRILTQDLCDKYESYRKYMNIENSEISKGTYLCSSHLAYNIFPQVNMFLSESNKDTRAVLKEQLVELRIEPQVLLDDMKGLGCINATVKKGPIYMLIDPFFQNDEELQDIWSVACNCIQKLHDPNSDGIIEMFQYRKSEMPKWFTPPQGFIGPVAVKNHRPHFLAAYTTAKIKEEVESVLDKLGWECPNNQQLL